jgi:hypothetical protein
MKILLKLLITYQDLLPLGSSGSECEIDIPLASKARDILTRFGVPVDENTVILINGRSPQHPDGLLSDGDVLCAFPVAAGG